MTTDKFIEKLKQWLTNGQSEEIKAKGIPDLVIVNPDRFSPETYEELKEILDFDLEVESCNSFNSNNRLSFFWDVRRANSLWN